jgi:hypothetical protein
LTGSSDTAYQQLGVLHDPADSASAAQPPIVQQGARALGKEPVVVEARVPEEFAQSRLTRLGDWTGQGNASSNAWLDCEMG